VNSSLKTSNLKKIRAVVFDMDGLLLDSEKISLATFIEACRENNYEPDVAAYYRCIGTTPPKTREIIMEAYGGAFNYQAVSDCWRKRFNERALNNPIPLKDGALDLLEFLESRNIKKVVVTSTYRENARKMLTNAGIFGFFEFIIGGDEISHGKPDPEIYLAACRKLGEASANCLALEDSNNGVLSAVAAGLVVIQVPDLVEPSADIKSLGHKIVRSLADVPAEFDS
jgi:HAD superfamily hydrolase (TIGR01509 family)